ncbi:hypothetical protein K474DRAFT_1499021 [Panus rudis PR-1116 ss-1]|nr:hypothetical protein K474DRAFT_1499021 [Panus rudis PR-1116 ss-1]
MGSPVRMHELFLHFPLNLLFSLFVSVWETPSGLFVDLRNLGGHGQNESHYWSLTSNAVTVIDGGYSHYRAQHWYQVVYTKIEAPRRRVPFMPILGSQPQRPTAELYRNGDGIDGCG